MSDQWSRTISTNNPPDRASQVPSERRSGAHLVGESRRRPDARPPRRPTADDGFVVVDKPGGMTSHDVVAAVRKLVGTRRVGHGGTLDPMATGVLVCAIGRATRLLTYVSGSDKNYDATIRLGIGTSTDDREGEVVATPGFSVPARDVHTDAVRVPLELKTALATLTGEIMQVPTAVSAIRVDGKRAYQRLRDGEQVDLVARPVRVHEFVLLQMRPGEVAGLPVVDLDVSVRVSAGTYVRALARDLGTALGSAGHLTMLRRTYAGGYGLSEARTLADISAAADAANNAGLALATIPMAQAAAKYLPVREISDLEEIDLGFGRWISATGEPGPHAAVTAAGELVAIVEDTARGGGTSSSGQVLAKPVLVLRNAAN